MHIGIHIRTFLSFHVLSNSTPSLRNPQASGTAGNRQSRGNHAKAAKNGSRGWRGDAESATANRNHNHSDAAGKLLIWSFRSEMIVEPNERFAEIVETLSVEKLEDVDWMFKELGEDMVRQIYPNYPMRYGFRPASDDDLDRLRQLGLPEGVIDFYRKFEPLNLDGPVRVASISGLVAENTEAIPGIAVSKLGYVVFATTHCGNAICFDTNTPTDADSPRIVHISHEEDYGGLEPSAVMRNNEVVCDGLLEFWELFASGDPEHQLDPVARR